MFGRPGTGRAAAGISQGRLSRGSDDGKPFAATHRLQAAGKGLKSMDDPEGVF